MITVKVCRGSSYPGECRDDDVNLKWGDDISDPLLVNDSVAQERGRVDIDRVFTNRKSVDLVLNTIEFVQPGSLVTLDEGVTQNNGLLKNISLQYSVSDDVVSVGSSVRIERNI